MNDNFKLFEAAQLAMANNAPNSRWIKVQLSRISVKLLDPMNGQPTEVIVAGNPETEKDSCVVNCWTPLETAYFEQNNRYHILNGNIVPFNKPVEIATSENTLTDEQIIEVLEKKFMAVKHLLDKLDSVVTVKRILRIAKDLNKPSATITAIEAKLSQLQELEYQEK